MPQASQASTELATFSVSGTKIASVKRSAAILDVCALDSEHVAAAHDDGSLAIYSVFTLACVLRKGVSDVPLRCLGRSH